MLFFLLKRECFAFSQIWKKGGRRVYLNGINLGGLNYLDYMQGYKTGRTGSATESMVFSDVLQRAFRVKTPTSASSAAKFQRELKLHGKSDANAGEQIVGSFINAQAGSSSAIYKPADFDSSNPVYHVKTWDADGNMTERTVDISKINSRNSDYVDMYTYSWHLNNSGQYPQAQLKFAVANAYQQALLGSNYQAYMPTKTNWVNVVNSLMQTQYNAGNLQGYLDYSKFLGFLL